MGDESRAPSPRLSTVDGWRGISVLGVLWWHSWIHTGNPSVFVGSEAFSVNLQRLFVLLGNGVDFFFVISGFCIHQSMESRMPALTPSSYGRFVLNRILRLSPTFYVVCGVTAVALAIAGTPTTSINLVAHATWLFGIWPDTWQLASPFWSLRVEWEFYLCAPLVLLLPRPVHRWSVLAVLWLSSLALRHHLHDTVDGIALSGTDHLPMHFSAFIFGMIVSEGWRLQARWLSIFQGGLPLLTGLSLAFLGRGLSSTESFVWFGTWGVWAKTFGDPIMVVGFAMMLASTLSKQTGVTYLLRSPPVQMLGRMSYGLYLWHWWPSVWICHALVDNLGKSIFVHYLGLISTLAVCLPLAWLTYALCERPYFRSRRLGHSPSTTGATKTA